jgi:hypothetical protein
VAADTQQIMPTTDREFEKALQDFVAATRMLRGHIQVALHEGLPAKAEFVPEYLVTFDPRGTPQHREATASLQLGGVAADVRSFLARAIRAKAGPFGRLDVAVRGGRAVRWGFVENHRSEQVGITRRI